MALQNCMTARMAAEATLRALGGGQVSISAAMTGDDASSAGLGTGSLVQQQWELEPVVVRWKTVNDEKHRELVVSAETLERAFNTFDTEILEAVLLRAQVKLGNEALRVTAVSNETCGGHVYLYRVRVEK